MPIYKTYDKATLDDQYHNRSKVPEFDDIVQRWQDDSARLRQQVTCHQKLAYGTHPREYVDIFTPILTFLFGEAQLGGNGAIVSTHRLHNEFYGLPGDDDLLYARTLKEVLHELGHTMGLIHCQYYECVMHFSTYVEDIDLKKSQFCPVCKNKLEEV